MFATLRAVVLSLASLVLGETVQIGPHAVTRSSLFGYTVEGRTLDADEAATVLVLASAPPHADLLRGPSEAFPGSGRRSETWRAGHAADRRYAALRRALGGHNVTRDTTPAPSFTGGSATVEIRYVVARGAVLPEIERAS